MPQLLAPVAGHTSKFASTKPTPFGAFFMPALILLICVVQGFLSPFGFYPWLSFLHEAWLFASLLPVCAVIVWRAWRSKSAPLNSALTPLVFTILVIMGLQSVLMPNLYLGDVTLGVVYMSGMWVAWQFGLQHDPAKEDHFKALAFTWMAIALISALMAFVQFLELASALNPWVITPTQLHRATANLAQPNNLATFLLMGVVATVWLYETVAISGTFTTVVIAVLSLGVLSAQSRTAMLSAVGLVIIHYGMLRKNMPIRIQPYKVWLWCAGLIACSWAIKFITTYDEFHLNNAVAFEGRIIIWKQLLMGLQESPWWGFGWLQTPAAQQAGALHVIGTEQTTYSHNLVLDLCVWFGVPAGLLISGVAAVWLLKRWQLATRARTLMGFAFVLPLGVHSMLELPFSYAYFLFPAAWVMGMIDRDTSAANQVVTRFRGRLESLLAISFVVLTVWIGLEYIKVEEDFRMARFEKQKINAVPADYLRPSLVLLTQWRDLLDAMRIPVARDMRDEQLALLARASQRFSWLALHFSYSLALDLNGRAPDAARERQVIKGLFGPVIYQQVLNDYRALAETKYPELKAIALE